VNAAEIGERRRVVSKLMTRDVADLGKFEIEGLLLIAEQLAELNEKLTPARLVSAIEEIQAEIEKHDRRRKDSGGGPP
jgi:hypothetical protein